MTSPSRFIDRRDAAVTAALAGAVVIVLGYASGVGIRPESAVTTTVQQPAEPATIAPSTPIGPIPVAVAAPVPIVVPPPTIVQRGPAVTPTPTPSPTPTPTPVPTPAPEPTCSPGLLDSLVGGLPLVGDVTGLLSGLLGSNGLLGTGGLLGTAAAPAAAPSTTATDPAACSTGSLLGRKAARSR